jgi:hypothetical protein
VGGATAQPASARALRMKTAYPIGRMETSAMAANTNLPP